MCGLQARAEYFTIVGAGAIRLAFRTGFSALVVGGGVVVPAVETHV